MERHERRRRRQGQGGGALLPGGAENPNYAKQRIGGVFKDARSQDRALEHPRHRHGASTAATSRPCVRSSPKSASCRARTARRCSPAARPRRWWSRRSAPARTSSGSTRCRGPTRRSFLLHYNFPPYSVGETGRMGGTKRREIGHGKLAWRAIHPVLPKKQRVPLHHPRRVGDHRVERLVLDGDGVRRLARV